MSQTQETKEESYLSKCKFNEVSRKRSSAGKPAVPDRGMEQTGVQLAGGCLRWNELARQPPSFSMMIWA
jgi:phage portal protein BeeE